MFRTLTHEEIDHNIKNVWSLQEYIAFINQEKEGMVVFNLVDDPQHWTEIGVHTASDLADYLDTCAEAG